MSVSCLHRVAGALALGASLSVFAFSASAHEQEAKAGNISVLAPWARATPARAGGVFLTLRNDGADPDRLIGVASEVAPMANLHESRQENGVMQMRPVDGIDLPPHATVSLKPGGYHVMLMGLTKPLKAGETFPLTLSFAKAGKVTVTVTVKSAGATSSASTTSMDHMDMNHNANQ